MKALVPKSRISSHVCQTAEILPDTELHLRSSPVCGCGGCRLSLTARLSLFLVNLAPHSTERTWQVRCRGVLRSCELQVRRHRLASLSFAVKMQLSCDLVDVPTGIRESRCFRVASGAVMLCLLHSVVH